MLAGLCVICGDKAKERICLACHVFFRRSVMAKKKYKCQKAGSCDVGLKTRNKCQSCRLKKCLKRGLEPSGPRFREPPSPRKLAYKLDINESQISSMEVPDFILLQRLQQKQHLIHRRNRNPEPATCQDANCSLTWAFKNSNEFAMQFKCYRDLMKNERNLILAEFAIAYMLIDQGFKTCQEARSNWILQNDSILETSEFSNFLFETLAKPFQNLKIDRIECVFLKSLALLTPSINGNVLFKGSDTAKTMFTSQLMTYSSRKFPLLDSGAERFGEVVLLMSSIRCAVKKFYNQTRRNGIFELKNIEPVIRKRMLS